MTINNTTSTERYWICPLYTFTCDSDRIVLDNGVEIKSIPEEFKDYIKRKHETRLLQGEITIPAFIFQLRCNEEIEKPENKLLVSGAEVIRILVSLINFIHACRIHKSGSVFPGESILCIPETNNWSFGPNITTYLSKSYFHSFLETNYLLKAADIPKIDLIIHLLEQFFDLENRTILNRALRRFSSAYHGDIDDRLVDQMIAFESLFLGDNKELSFKLRLRIAFFLPEQKENIFKDIKTAYDLRGQIVHGAKNINRKKLEEILPKSEEYLRQSLLKFLLLLSKGMSLEEIRNRLDQNILSNGKSLTYHD